MISTSYIISQLIGMAGVACQTFSYQSKSNKGLYTLQLIGCFMFCLQFLMIHAYSGAINLVVLIARNLMLTGYKDHAWIRKGIWKWILSALSIGALFLTWTAWYDILTCIAIIAGNFGMWTNNARKIRLANLACISPCWLLYDLQVAAWSGVLNEIIVISSILVSIYRFGWKTMDDRIKQ